MADKVTGVEASAISVLKRAVELDSARRFDESLVCYQEGIQLLMNVLKMTPGSEDAKKSRMREKIKDYINRAEKLKTFVEEEKKAAKEHIQIQIENNSTGHSYEQLFGHLLNEPLLTSIEVQDPYIRSVHQIYNFLRFCELVVKSKCSCKHIKLLTKLEDTDPEREQQMKKLSQIGNSLKKHGVTLEISTSSTLHDREIRLNTGWVIKIGRGLDYFKATDSKFDLGYCDFDLRPCHETTVDIFHRKNTDMS